MDQLVNAPLFRFTTIKIGGEADYLYSPTTIDELTDLVCRLQTEGQPWHVLGGGSNLLIASAGVRGSVIRTTRLTPMSNPEPGIIEAGSGCRLPHLARYASSLALSGLEFAVGIPGTVGGGIIMNAGAHGGCISDILESATVFDTRQERLVTLGSSELKFGYRTSGLDPKAMIVVSARFRLLPDDREAIEIRVKRNEEYRWKTQPINWPSAGSTFKNPEPARGAGLLLDQSGCKMLKEGNAQVSALHANFVINTGGATSSEVTTLLRRMQETVYNCFHVRLNPEWKIMGEFSPVEHEIWNGKH